MRCFFGVFSFVFLFECFFFGEVKRSKRKVFVGVSVKNPTSQISFIVYARWLAILQLKLNVSGEREAPRF